MAQISVAKYHMTLTIFLMVILFLSFHVAVVQFASAQQQVQQPIPSVTDELVTYEKYSSFIKEFPIPLKDRGLRGITTDSDGNAWFLHSTNKTSTIFKLEPETGKFTQYPINGETVADNPVINLAAAQLVFDKERGAIWFTDARVNSIGKLDEASGQIKLWQVPTNNSGPMGIVLSPDGKSLWFAEIIGNNIARFDIQSEKIVEYSTGENSGPALMAFDEKGQLWVSLSFSDSIMLTQIGKENDLESNSSSSSIGMVNMSLPKPDRFSPLGIAISGGKVYLSDHGSSRVIVADENSGLQSYDVYWTSSSASPILPATLPGQVIVDKKSGNVYFPQHGGNRITEIRLQDGLMTEYDIPTGPISTVLFLTASDEGRIWFTEWASNKVAYLDTSIQVPFEQQVQQKSITLTKSSAGSLNVLVKSTAANASVANSNSSNNNSSTSSLSLSQVEVGLTGMSESGPTGITYQANPPRVNLQENSSSVESTIQLKAEDNAKPGTYTAMVRVQAPEQDGLIISRLYPIKLVLDVPQPTSIQTGPSASNSQPSTLFEIRDLIRALAIAAAIGLAGYIVYTRVKRKPIRL
jgi:virginiamycin B lyase